MYADAKLGELLIARTDGHHGTGEIGEAMGIVSGFVLHAPSEPSVYIAGDTILCDEVRAAIDEHQPAAVLVNASAARFNTGDPIVMTNDDVVALAARVPGRDGRRDPLRDRLALHRDARGPARPHRRASASSSRRTAR